LPEDATDVIWVTAEDQKAAYRGSSVNRGYSVCSMIGSVALGPIDACREERPKEDPMDARGISRRDVLLTGGSALAALAFLRLERLVSAAPLRRRRASSATS
jgi:hypothetical protein